MPTDEPRVQNLVDDLVSNRIDRRQFVRRAVGLGLSLPAAGALLAACGGDDEVAGGGGGGGGAETGGGAGGGATEAVEVPETLRIRLGADVTNLDPAFYPSSVDEAVFTNIGEGLVGWQPGTFDIVNVLAETFEPSSDGLSYEFKLKEGIQWQKGYGEVTAEDVKFSYERIAGLTKPKIESPYSGDWAPQLKEVVVKDTYSGTIVLNEPFAALMRSTLPVGAGIVLPKKAIEERGDKFATDPVGSGPYEFVSWTPNQRTVIKRFADYGGASEELLGSPFNEIHFFPIPEDSAADIALETGEVDFGIISLEGIDRFESNDNFAVNGASTLDYNWIGMNVLHPKLEDIRVRQAIRLAVDVPSIIEAAFDGRYARANAIIPENMGLGYWADAPQYDRDVDAAKQLLADAGVSSLELSLTFTEDTGANELAQIVQANLADIGIDVSLNKVDAATLYALGENLRERQLFFTGYVTEPDPSWSFVWFTCKQLDVWNWMYWCNEEFDRLHFAALKEQDEAARSDMYVQMQQLWDEAAHTVWVSYPTNYYGYRKGIEPAIAPHGRMLPLAFKAV